MVTGLRDRCPDLYGRLGDAYREKMRNEAWACPTASKAAEKYGRRRMLFDEAFELARRAEAIGRQEDASPLKAARLTYS
jgi:hypothetical protein